MEDEAQVEALAMLLHEAGREAVQRALVLNKPGKPQGFIEWKDLPEDACEGRRIQARFLLGQGVIRRERLPAPISGAAAGG